MSLTVEQQRRRWFLTEIWYDIRERFKAIVGDALLFITAKTGNLI